MKYDDASWHYGGNFPKDLPAEAGATHIGMFVAWAWMTGLAGEDVIDEMPDAVAALNERSITPGKSFFDSCDGKFVDDDLNAEGNAFAVEYFDFKTGQYLNDYDELLTGDLPSVYHVPDTWESFDRLRPRLDERYREWSGRN
ncbi:hypothetical protein [Novipirellula caenicola]|uniref:DUF7832 domain-containing protein n=1 Tax=Novipirellula caenicola TaxID=1536901 RepID=A0ABP9W5M9_9BACT